MGDHFDMSGDFRGAIVNIKSTLRDVQQSVGQIQAGDESSRLELKSLIEQLNKALENAPPEKKEQAEAVAQSAKALVENAKGDQPNKTMVKITGEGLKQAAQNLAEALPTVVGIATQIVLAVTKMTGG